MKYSRIFKHSLFLLLLGCCCITSVYAQNRTIAGRVTDDKTGDPIEGVSVMVSGTKIATVTDKNGNFSLTVPAESKSISISHVGFLAKEMKIGESATINMSLVKINNSMEDVVVVGYGARKRANVLGSVATVQAKDLEEIPAANLSSALINRAPGVGVMVASGKPGATAGIRIRNPNPFVAVAGDASVQPLYVIDGFQLTQEDFNNLDATQIEEITFLKDAAASIYGSRGANGVVLVTTKKGKPGRAKISYQGSHGVATATKFPDMLTGYEHASVLNGLMKANNIVAVNHYTNEELEYLKTHRYNWLDDVSQDAYVSRHTINISGGSDNVTYFAGGSYYKETGNLRDLYADKYSLRLGMTAKIADGLNASVTLSTDNSKLNRPSPKGVTVQSESLSETVSSLMLMPEWVPMYIDGKPVYSSTPGWHPYELQNSGSYARSESEGITLNASLEYKIPGIKGLTVRASYGRNTRNGLGKEYYASYNLYDFQRIGAHQSNQNIIFTNQLLATNGTRRIPNGDQIYLSHGSAKNYQLNEAISYNNDFGDHSLSVMVAAEQGENSGDDFMAKREKQVISGIDQIFGFTQDKNFWDNSGSSTEGGRMSYLGRLNYGYKDKYLLEGVFRADASPNFPPGSDWGYFPSVAVGWKISEENFFRDHVSFIDNLKIRFQVGLTGNDRVNAFGWKTRYTQTTGYLFGSTLTSGINNNSTPNSQITWEKALYKNLGFDGTVFKNRLSFALDLYHRYNYDMFDNPVASIPTTFGGAISPQNYGKMVTYGVELGLTYNGQIGREFKYSVGVITGWNDNRVRRRYVSDVDVNTWRDPNGRRTDNGIEGYQSLGIVKTQEELDAFMAKNPGYTIDGQTPKLGWILFQDIDGDGKISDVDKTRLRSRTAGTIGMGHNFGFSYKGWRFSVNLNWGIGGYDVYDKPARTVPNNNQSALAHWKDAWSPDNPNGNYPILDARYAAEIHEMWIVKATYMTINNMNVSYTLPNNWLGKAKISSLRIFATGTNMWDIINPTPYKYSRTNLSTDYPATRVFTLGLNVTM